MKGDFVPAAKQMRTNEGASQPAALGYNLISALDSDEAENASPNGSISWCKSTSCDSSDRRLKRLIDSNVCAQLDHGRRIGLLETPSG